MRCFSVIALIAACISASSCMSYMAGGGYGQAAYEGASSQFGASAEQSQFAQSQSQSAESFEQSSGSYESGAQQFGAAGYQAGYGAASYGAGAAGSYGAAAGSYGAGAAGAYGSAVGSYGAAAGSYGSAAYGAQSVGQAAGASNYQAGNFQSTKFSKSASSSSIQGASSSAAVAASSSNYAASLSYYPKLSNIPFFSNCYNFPSAGDDMSYASLWTDSFNVQSTLSSMFQSNSLFKSYFCSATGMDFSRYSASEMSRVYSAFGSNKGAFVGLVRNFARRGYIYNTSFANNLITMQSTEFFSSASRFASYANSQSWSQMGLNRFFANSYYRTQIASFCGIQSWDEAIVTRTLSNYFRTNAVGTSLFFRHLLLNRVSSSCSYQQYASLTSSSYLSARSQSFNYYGGFYNAFSQSSSSSSSFARSSSFQSASSASSSSSYSAMSASSTKQFSSVSQYYGSTFGSSSLFKSCFTLASCETSSESSFYSSAFSSGFDYSSAYGPVLQDKLFRRYLFGCFGGYYDVSSSMTSQLFSYAQQYPGFFARTTKLYARNGGFFTSQLGRLFIEQDSAACFSSSVSSFRSSLMNVQSWSSCGLSSLFESRYYQRKMASFFGMSSYDYSSVSSAMVNLFQRNYAGGLLALRHLVNRKYVGQSFTASSYYNIRSASSYSNMLAYRCPFYSSWSSYYQQYSKQSYSRSASSFSRSAASQSMQQQSASNSYGAASGAASSYGAAGGVSSYGAAAGPYY